MKYFFSYARADSGFVLKLAQDLREAGVEVWLDQLDILGGQRWDRAVQDALETCDGMIAVLSPASVASHNVMDEVSYTLEKGKPVVPVLAQACEVPFRLRRVQHVDFTGAYEAAFPQLLRAVGAPVGAAKLGAAVGHPESEHPESEHPGRSVEPPAGRLVPPVGDDPPFDSKEGNRNEKPTRGFLQRAGLGALGGALWSGVLFIVMGVKPDWATVMLMEVVCGAILATAVRRRTVRFVVAGGVMGAILMAILVASSPFVGSDVLGMAFASGGGIGLPAGAILGLIVGTLAQRWARRRAPAR